MESYDLFIDRKCTVWIREHVTIEADSLGDAVEKCKNGIYDDSWDEILYGTEEDLSLSDNDGEATFEIYEKKTHDLLYSNK